jgi:hypothetical protein
VTAGAGGAPVGVGRGCGAWYFRLG